MLLLILFAFLAGIVTVLSPCILPLLPIILSSSDKTGKEKPFGVITGFIISFTFFTLFLSTIVKLGGFSASSLRLFSIIVLATFGLSLLIPKVQLLLEILSSKLSRFIPSGKNKGGFIGGLIIGLSLGLLWTPCVGPILASVISLAITGTVSAQAFFITLSYAIGTALPMLIIMLAGGAALQKVPWLVKNTQRIQKAFGVLMILTSVGIFFNVDRKFQSYILEVFPKYGTGLTKFEETEKIKNELDNINSKQIDQNTIGKPMKNITDTVKNNPAPELILGGEWFNSEPLQLKNLKGKVVLVDFWTYSCINCQRTLPYVKNWWEKYKDKGLVIIGVHAPEFEFEKDPKNVQKAAKDFGLNYPIMQDNNFATWKAYDNHYWPAKYLVDKDGNIRYSHFGEGSYDQTEKMIQDLLEETGSNVSDDKISNQDYQIYSKTPESYLGYSRIQNLSSPEDFIENKETNFSVPKIFPSNTFAYEGQWLLMPEYASPSAGSRLYFNFEAKEVFLVARSKNKSSQIKVEIDGKTQYFGQDNKDGIVIIDSDRLYKLINLPTPGKHILNIEFQDNNAEVYAFTFG